MTSPREDRGQDEGERDTDRRHRNGPATRSRATLRNDEPQRRDVEEGNRSEMVPVGVLATRPRSPQSTVFTVRNAATNAPSPRGARRAARNKLATTTGATRRDDEGGRSPIPRGGRRRTPRHRAEVVAAPGGRCSHLASLPATTGQSTRATTSAIPSATGAEGQPQPDGGISQTRCAGIHGPMREASCARGTRAEAQRNWGAGVAEARRRRAARAGAAGRKDVRARGARDGEQRDAGHGGTTRALCQHERGVDRRGDRQTSAATPTLHHGDRSPSARRRRSAPRRARRAAHWRA